MGFLDTLGKINPLIGVASGVVDSFANLFNTKKEISAQRYNADLQYKASQENLAWQREQQQIANAFNLDMWQREMDYNTPKNQMERLVDAGLNPALMYSQGTTGNTTNAPSFHGVNPDPSAFAVGSARVASKVPMFGSVVRSFIDTLTAAQDLQNRKEQNDLIGAQADYWKANAELKSIEADYGMPTFESRLRSQLQRYILNGGDMSEEDSKLLHSYVMDERRLKNDVRSSSIDFLRATRDRQLEDINRIKAVTRLTNEMEQWNKNRNHEYDSVYRPINETLGPYRPMLEATGDKALDIVGSLIEHFATRGSKSLKSVIDEVFNIDKKNGRGRRIVKKTIQQR